MELHLQNKVALVCGSSKGIGRAIAQLLSAEGVKVVLLARNQEALTQAASSIQVATGFLPMTVAADLSQPESYQRAVNEVLACHQQIDILVNNAGGPPPGSFLDHDSLVWQNAFQQNLLATVELCRLVAPGMKERQWGRIINITTALYKEPTALMVISATLRAGVSAHCKAISKELAPFGITVNTICPGAVMTERAIQLTRLSAERQGLSYEEVLAASQARQPTGRFAEPEEIAGIVAFLASAHGAYVSGRSLVVDGSHSMSY